MIGKPDGWSIVLAGAWNRAIFTPPWIDTKLGVAGDVEARVPMFVSAPLVYLHKQVQLFIEESRVRIGAVTADHAGMDRVEEVAARLLEALPETPVIGAGVNFGFVEGSPTPDHINLFNVADHAGLGEVGWSIGARAITRTLEKADKKLTCNLILSMLPGGAVSFDLNFHFDVPNASAARTHILGATRGLLAEAHDLLRNAYNLEPEGADGISNKQEQ